MRTRSLLRSLDPCVGHVLIARPAWRRHLLERYKTCESAAAVTAMQEQILAELEKSYDDSRRAAGEFFSPTMSPSTSPNKRLSQTRDMRFARSPKRPFCARSSLSPYSLFSSPERPHIEQLSSTPSSSNSVRRR